MSLNGPWERPAQPVLTGAPAPSWEGGMVANPGVVVTANDSLLMAYRGLNDRGIGMAVSPRWDQPFTRLNGGAPVLGPSANPPTPVDEDMTMYVCPPRPRPRALRIALNGFARIDPRSANVLPSVQGARRTRSQP